MEEDRTIPRLHLKDEVTRVSIRRQSSAASVPEPSQDSSLVGTFRRGQPAPTKPSTELEPVVGWLVIVEGPGRGQALALRYGMNALGSAEGQRLRVSFGDERIVGEDHVFVSYDIKSRAFYVSQGRGPELGWLNGILILQMSPLKRGDTITAGVTEFAFVPFCGPEFDWQAPKP